MEVVPGAIKLIEPLGRFIQVYDENIDEYLPISKIEAVLTEIENDHKVERIHQDEVLLLLSGYAIYKILKDMLERFYLTSHGKQKMNALLKSSLVWAQKRRREKS